MYCLMKVMLVYKLFQKDIGAAFYRLHFLQHFLSLMPR